MKKLRTSRLGKKKRNSYKKVSPRELVLCRDQSATDWTLHYDLKSGKQSRNQENGGEKGAACLLTHLFYSAPLCSTNFFICFTHSAHFFAHSWECLIP